jgi:paraquat-inducible protein A
MSSPAVAAPAAPSRIPHWNRWSVFFSLMGLVVIIPSFLVPMMLVANALEGPRLFSVVTGIRELWITDHGFLAGLILVFSVAFPLIKLLLSLLCASGRSLLSRRSRGVLVYLASWTAKYSMLDVLVVAVLVMTVKVGDYVHVEASQGIYMFCFAIVCSAIAGGLLELGLRYENELPPVDRRRWPLHAALTVAGGAVAAWAWTVVMHESGGQIENIRMARLTKRGALKRSIEKNIALQDLTKPGHQFFSKDTGTKVLEFLHAVSTDAGWQKPDAYLELHLKEEESRFDFPLLKPVAWNDVDHMRLLSIVSYMRGIQTTNVEETVRADTETYSLWTRNWNGRIYTFKLEGPRGRWFVPALILCGAGLITGTTALSALLAGARARRP